MSDSGQSDLPLPQWLMSEKAKAAALEAAERHAQEAAKKRAEDAQKRAEDAQKRAEDERARVQQRLAAEARRAERDGQVKPSAEAATQLAKNNQAAFGRPHRSHIASVRQAETIMPTAATGDLDIPKAPDEADPERAPLTGQPRFTKSPLLKAALAGSSMASSMREKPSAHRTSRRSTISSPLANGAQQNPASDRLSSASDSGEDVEMASALDAFVKDQIRAEADALARRRERTSDRPLASPHAQIQAQSQALTQAQSQALTQAPTQAPTQDQVEAPMQTPIQDTTVSLTPPQSDLGQAGSLVQPLPAQMLVENSATPAVRETSQQGLLGRLWDGLTHVVRALILFIFLLLCSLVAGFLFGYLGIANSL